ncbi:replicative DNA helicase [bacterium]|nr:replicative DNA helicase [candidate division CSSED10-310 bacterium]
MSKQPKTNKDRDSLPPNDLAAEKAVIAGLIRNNEAIHDVIRMLQPEDFFRETNQIVYSSILQLFEASRPFDLITLKNQIEYDGHLTKIGGIMTLSEMLDEVSLVSNVQFYAEIVKEKSRLRNLINAAHDIVTGCYATETDSKEIIDRAEQQVFKLSDQLGGDRVANIDVAIKESFEELKSTYHLGVSGLKTGFDDFDRMTSGLHPGELIVIAGRPAMGKTTFGMNVAEYVARKFGAGTLIFSLEMVRSQVALRLLSAESQIDVQRLKKGQIAEEEWNAISAAGARIGKLPLFIDDTPNLSVMEMRSTARRLTKKNPIGLIMVDYIQLIRGDGRAESRQLEISQISRSLKFLAKELKCPVIALSQLSRAVENRPGKKRPMLSDLRESGAIEQDADLVVMLYRPEYYNETEVIIDNKTHDSKGLSEIIIAKQRNGPVGSFWLAFQHSLTRFVNLDPRTAVPVDVIRSHNVYSDGDA